MKIGKTVKINFRGGIISPGILYNILVAAGKARAGYAGFGLRQQVLIDILNEHVVAFTKELGKLGIAFEVDRDEFPNLTSSYPAEEVFIKNTWLSEGVYKDIFDGIDFKPLLKINISDSNQSFTPMLTGNINWVASPEATHFWHLFIRFPKTNVIGEWNQLVYTNDIARASKHIEALIFEHRDKFYDNASANGEELFALLAKKNYITRKALLPARLPAFNLPYYEGFNRYQDKNWLGIYRRDEMFSVNFLKEMCQLCLQTKIGQICSTPWKSVIIKNIEEKDRVFWNSLLVKYQVNVRHAANELNFQVEDNCSDGLSLKHYLVKHLHNDDMRTFGISIGIKTRRKSEIFSSILIRKRPLLTIFGRSFFHVYDILCSRNFNPNERTGTIYSKGNIKALLPEQLRRTILYFYAYQNAHANIMITPPPVKNDAVVPPSFVFQCRHCLSIYDEKTGEPENGINAGTLFAELPADFSCELCDAPKEDFIMTTLTKVQSAAI